jgi:flagellar biosynthetic protein FliQ
MTIEVFLDVMRDGITLLIQIITPPLLISLIVGLIIGIFQAVTQIHEQTLMFAPRLLVIFITLLLMGGWMFQKIMDFAKDVLEKYFQMI